MMRQVGVKHFSQTDTDGLYTLATALVDYRLAPLYSPASPLLIPCLKISGPNVNLNTGGPSPHMWSSNFRNVHQKSLGHWLCNASHLGKNFLRLMSSG